MKVIDITELDDENFILVIERYVGLFKKKLVINQIFRRGANMCFDTVTYKNIEDKQVKALIENYIFMRKKLNSSFHKRAAGVDSEYMQRMFNQLQGMKNVNKRGLSMADSVISPFGSGLSSMRVAASGLPITKEEAFRAMMSGPKPIDVKREFERAMGMKI